MANGECVIGARHDAEIKALQAQHEELRAVDQEQWAAINVLRNRLPVWATVAISMLTAGLGFLLAFAKARGG